MAGSRVAARVRGPKEANRAPERILSAPGSLTGRSERTASLVNAASSSLPRGTLRLCRSSDRLKMRGAARAPGRPAARIPSSSRRCARHRHGGAQAQKFPRANSCTISLSSVRSTIALRSRWFLTSKFLIRRLDPSSGRRSPCASVSTSPPSYPRRGSHRPRSSPARSTRPLPLLGDYILRPVPLRSHLSVLVLPVGQTLK